MQHDEITVREIAAATRRDPRTVRKVLRGEPVTPLIDAEVRRELARRERNASIKHAQSTGDGPEPLLAG